MRLHRFYIQTPISKETFDVSNRDLIHQWRIVFRYNVGSQIVLFDGSGLDYLCIITSLRNLGATVSVLEKKKNTKSFLKNIWLCVSIIKKDNFEFIVEKTTELGVMHIIPILAERSEKKSLDLERLERIAQESSEQSGRPIAPKIHNIVSLLELLKSDILPKPARPNEFGHSGGDKIVLNPDGKYIGDFLSDKNPKDLAVFIGPEGGWSEKELDQFEKNNIPIISLGHQILRSETVAIAVSSLLLL